MKQVQVELCLRIQGYILHQQGDLLALDNLQMKVLFLVEDYGVAQETAILRTQEVEL